MPRPARKALAIADEIAERIANRLPGYGAGAYLVRRELAAEFGRDRDTVDRALAMLVDRDVVAFDGDGFARVKVRPKVRQSDRDLVTGDPSGQWKGFGSAVANIGGTPYVDVLETGDSPVPSEAARWLGIEAGMTAVVRHRLYGVVEAGRRIPVSIGTTWITAEAARRAPRVRDADTGSGGITQRLIDAGYTLRYEDTPTARLPNPVERDLLELDPGRPVLRTWRRTFGGDGDEVVKVSLRVSNPDLYETVYRFG